MQATRTSRCLYFLRWEAKVSTRVGAPSASSASTITNPLNSGAGLQHDRVSSLPTFTACRGLGCAVRQLTIGSRTTQPQRSLARFGWRASASSRVDCMRRHDTSQQCRRPNSSCSIGGSGSSSLTAAAAAAAALPRGAIIGRRWRETAAAAAAGGGAARRGMSSSTMPEREFHLIADEALEDIHDAVEEALEDGFAEEFDCNMSQGVLNIVAGDRGTWVLNKQSPNRQIWWSSPISGPMRFEYHDDSRRWLNTRDGKTELRDLLAKEMGEKCGVSLFHLD